jgi:predicted cupin superfamily sugar epimerase
MNDEADRLIVLLDLKPHPEGGHYRETFRDRFGHEGRPHSTAIYFLLRQGEVSRWHRIDAVEMWHWYKGAALELNVGRDRIVLGPNVAAGERPQAIVPKGAWQKARSLGAFSLVGCTVAPAFEFAGFELAPEDFDPGQAIP